ncbi:hypothetical protein SHIRM173S_05850 [Streptomyces hirsutus]
MRHPPSVMPTSMVQLPCPYANGPVITCWSDRRPSPPRKSAVHSAEVVVRSRVQSQYGMVTAESTRRRASSRSSRNRRCQGRKEGAMCAVRSPRSPSEE